MFCLRDSTPCDTTRQWTRTLGATTAILHYWTLVAMGVRTSNTVRTYLQDPVQFETKIFWSNDPVGKIATRSARAQDIIYHPEVSDVGVPKRFGVPNLSPPGSLLDFLITHHHDGKPSILIKVSLTLSLSLYSPIRRTNKHGVDNHRSKSRIDDGSLAPSQL